MIESSLNKFNKNIVILIDGSSFIYRAYFAIPGYLATTKGLPTKAVFGVTQMILKILKEWNPEYIIWFMDEKEPTFRHEIYENYKATRPKMPDDLKIQIPYIKTIISTLGIPIVSHSGYEGDDLIASFVKNIVKTLNLTAIIVAGDKDLYSLIDEKISIYDPVREKFLDLKTFFKKYQFPPQVFPEFRALTGDPSDNVPGVPGIGEKTAKELLIKFKNLENLYQNVQNLSSSKLKENLLKYKDLVLNNLTLLTLNSNAPLPSSDIFYYKRKEPDYPILRKIFKELEFRKLLSEIKYTPLEFKPLLVEIRDISQIPEKDCLSLLPLQEQGFIFASEKAPEIAVAFSEKEAYKFSEVHLKNLIQKFGKSKFILHDYKNFLKLFNFPLNKLFDTKLASYLLNPSLKKYDLESLLQEYLDISLNSLKISKNDEFAIKTCGLFLLGKNLMNRIKEENLEEWLEKVEIPLSEVLFEMERKGFKIDLEYVKILNQEYQKILKELEEKMFEIVGFKFNPRSSQELSHILFKKLNLPTLKKTPKGSLPSTDAEVLEELAPLHPLVKILIQYRTLHKIKSTYLEAFLKCASAKTHRIHTEFNQTGTTTGRLSSQNPNLQNIPVKGEEGLSIRRAFIAEEGCILCSLDYSQIELRILAHFSGDKNLIEAFKQEKDIHTFTACEVFGVSSEKVTPEMRRMSKAINFGIAYGMSAYGLAKELRISPKEAETIINRYFNRYAGIKEYIQKTIEFAKENGYVKTLAGRKRYIPELYSSNRAIKELGQRMAINTPIQGSAADLIKCAMVALKKELKKQNLETSIILQVHDELVLEVPENEIEIIKKLAPKIMENPFEYLNLPYKLNVPIRVNLSFGKTLAECK